MWQGLCNGMVSIRLSQHSAAHATVTGLLLWAMQMGNINRLLHGASAAGLLIHICSGGQQLMRAVLCCQLI